MQKTFIYLTCLMLLNGALFSQEDATTEKTPLAFTHVNVIDVTSGVTKSDMTVLITGNRITEIGKTTKSPIPKDAQIVDASDKFMIPGLWDMHVHAVWPQYYEQFLKLFIANGITAFRETWGSLELAQQIRDKMASGERPTQRMVVAGNLVDGPNPFWPGSVVAANAEQGRAVVDSLAEAGAAFIKVYSKLSPETYFAIGARAKEVGIPFAGHVPFRVMAAEASDAGQRTMEHLLGILAGCSTEEMQIMEESSNAWQTLAAGDSAAFLQMLYQIGQRKLETQSEPKANMLFAKLVENETWQVPTLVAWRGYRFTNDPAFRNDPRMKYLHKIMRAFWNPSINPLMKIRSEADWELGRRSYKQKLEVVGMMDKAGVPLLAGSDTPNPYAFPGFGLHDELELLVEAGLSPLAALQAATLNPARFFGATDSLGAVEIGKMADLVVLDENPLEDIRNTQKIYAVVANGQLLQRQQLDALLAEVEAENSKKSIAELMMKLIQADGVDTANEKYRQMKKETAKEYDFSEWELNMLGYQLLGTKKIKEAIKIFQLNVEAYPNSANVYDSLGEAFMLNGDRELAIENYKKSLELNPKNQNAVAKLRELESITIKK